MNPVFDQRWKDFLLSLYTKSQSSDIFGRAAETAFYFSFAIFPLLFFLISLFGLLLDSTETLKAETFAYLGQIMPGSAFDLVQKTVEEIVKSSSGGKLTLGLVFTFWSASAGVDGIRSGLNRVYGLRDLRSWWLTKLSSLGLTLFFTSIVGIVLGIVFYGWQIYRLLIAKLGIPISSPTILVGIQWASILILMLFVVQTIFNLLPAFPKLRWKWITPGSVVAVLLWLILTSIFRLYLAYFNNYDKAYGSLGAVMILMLWLYLTALVLLIGGAINAVLEETADLDAEKISAIASSAIDNPLEKL
jgi:membrane protein